MSVSMNNLFSRAAEFPASASESDTQTTEVPDQADHSTAVLPQPSEPEKKTDESERRPETAAPTEKEQPTPPATEESTTPEPPKEEPTEPVFDIDYWISFAKSYAESIGLVLDSGAVYCWDNPIAAGVKCKYTGVSRQFGFWFWSSDTYPMLPGQCCRAQ